MVCALTLLMALHGLHAEAKLKGDRVSVEAFFDDDTPAINARVTIANRTGETIAEGRTDERGIWSFPRPAEGQYTVAVDNGDGHRAKASLTIPSEMGLKLIHREELPGEAETVITPGPSRAEITRFPWLRAALGLAAIGCLAAVLWLASRKDRIGSNSAGRGDEAR